MWLCSLQAFFLAKGLPDATSGWVSAVPHYRLQLSRCLLLLSCGPVALTFALDVLKLRRKENLLRPGDARRNRCRDTAAISGSGRQTSKHQQQQQDQPLPLPVQLRQKQRPECHHLQSLRSKECSSSSAEVYGQLISSSALEDLAHADFLVFDKGTVVNGSSLHLHGVSAGGMVFASHQFEEDYYSGSGSMQRHAGEGKSTTVGTGTYPATHCSSANNLSVTDSLEFKGMLSRESTGCHCSCRDGILREDLSTLAHYYGAHPEERCRLEMLAQVKCLLQLQLAAFARKLRKAKRPKGRAAALSAGRFLMPLREACAIEAELRRYCCFLCKVCCRRNDRSH